MAPGFVHISALLRRALMLGTALAAFGACVTPVGLAPSNVPIDGRQYEPAGRVVGLACAENILGVPLRGESSLEVALERARNAAKADALIEVVIDRRLLITVFFNRICTEVHAIAIRFTETEEDSGPPTPASGVAEQPVLSGSVSGAASTSAPPAGAAQVPARYLDWCNRTAGAATLIEAKTTQIQGAFLRCTATGVELALPDASTRLMPFEQIWQVHDL